MPLVSTQASPWDSYPFRQPPGTSPTTSLNGNAAQVSASSSGQSIAGVPQPKIVPQSAFRDLTMSPGSRSSISNGSSTMVHSRGSLSSLGSIGSIGTISSRASLASVGSFSSGDPSLGGGGLDPSASMWHNNDDPSGSLAASSKGSSVGSIMGSSGSSFGQPISLVITGLPRDLTFRECHLIFTLAADFVSVEINRNAVSGDFSLTAKFNSVHGAQSASQLLERRTDLFGPDLKTTLQSYSSFVPQASQRSFYPSRPLMAEPHWGQQPATPLSPSLGPEFFSNSRRQSLISPTEQVVPSASMAQINLGASSPSHSSHLDSASTPVGGTNPGTANVATTSTMSMGDSSTGSPLSSSILSPTHTGTTSAIGTGAPSSSTGPVSSCSSTAPNTPTSHRPSLGSLGSMPVSSTAPQSQPVGATQNGAQNHQVSSEHPANNSHSQSHHYSDVQKNPPPNPADQNPPCNTLYVGNLPPDTSESELKELFSQQPGYRRLCFRTKQNGPMCFVEFEDEGLAGKALAELYGYVLSNSVKGGIRLSYSKNPLGVRSRPARR